MIIDVMILRPESFRKKEVEKLKNVVDVYKEKTK